MMLDNLNISLISRGFKQAFERLGMLVLSPTLTSITFVVNPLSPKSDENEISLNIITTCSNIQVIRIKEMITKDEMS